jgi:hypothetical protein
MQHPLVNPSLAPVGFVFPISRERLEYKSDESTPWVNTEKLIAEMWEEVNCAHAQKPLPLVTIIHKILPGLARKNKLEEGDFEFDGLPFLSRDIALISTFVQWFGTNVGGAFLETRLHSKSSSRKDHEFVIKFAEHCKQYNLIAHLMHVCTDRCLKGLYIFHSTGHDYSEKTVTDRDRAVVDGLMRWLGSRAGRAFIAEYGNRKKIAWNEVRKPLMDSIAKAVA